jgi:CrcB protein
MTQRGDRRDSHAELPLDPDPGPLSIPLIAWVAVGGAVGTAARYALTQWLPAGSGIPRGTLIANLIGAVVLGVLLETLARRGPDVGSLRRLRLAVGTGVCGGLTTYSTLAVETDLLARHHRDGLAVAYAMGSVGAGIALAGVGIALAVQVHRRSA